MTTIRVMRALGAAAVLLVAVGGGAAASDGLACDDSGACVITASNPAAYIDWTVPAGVTDFRVTLTGAAGGEGGRGEDPGFAARVTGAVDVAPGSMVRLAPGSAGRSAADGGGGGANPAGGFLGGAGGRAAEVADSAGGGGAASVVFVGDTVIVAGGAGGGSGRMAQGGGGGGISGGVAGAWHSGMGDSGLSTGSGFTVLPISTPVGSNGVIVVEYRMPAEPSAVAQFTDPARPLDSPRSVSQLAVAALAMLGAIGGRLLASDDGDHVEKPESIDTDVTHIGEVEVGRGDQWRIWSWRPLSFGRGTLRLMIRWWSSRSPAVARLLIDGAYLRSIVGSAAAAVPATAVAIAALTASRAQTPVDLPVSGVLALACLGALDALAGAVAFAVLAGGIALRFGIESAHTTEYLLALVAVGVVPPLAAMAFRSVRVRHVEGPVGAWERATDAVVTPLIATLTVTGVVGALPVMARSDMEVAGAGTRIALTVGAVFALRVLLEAAAARWFPQRLSLDHDEELPKPSSSHPWRAAALRVALLLTVAYTFIGSCWQLYCGTAVFAAGQVLGLVKTRFPNSPLLWQAIPGGVPGLAANLALGAVVAAQTHAVFGDTPHAARTAFALCGIPMLGWSALKAFGRSPAPGQVRWYRQPSRVWVYRLGGPIVLLCVLRLTHLI